MDDQELELKVGTLLRTGVSTAAAVVLSGAALYLARHGAELPRYQVFHTVSANHPAAPAIVEGILTGHGRSLIQAGLLTLIATPIARVAISLVAFARERDWLYVGTTTIVLGVLLFSILGT